MKDREGARRAREVRAGTKLAIAVALIVAFVVVAVGIDRLQKANGTPVSATEGVTAAQMVQTVTTGESALTIAEDGLPEGFESELFPAEGFTEMQHSTDGRVVGLTCSGSAKTAFQRCCEWLEIRGWTRIESGQAQRATFIKSDGTYTWCCVDCTAVGRSTSVVVILQKGSE